MVEIEFDLNQESIVVQVNLNDIFQVAIDSYIKKSLLDPNSIFFLANGRQINPNETVESQMSNINKANKRMKVLVQFLKKDTIVDVTIKSNEIICSKCKEPCLLEIEDYKIKLYKCKNNHINKIKIKDFPDTQKINISKIICGNCKIKNKGNCPNNKFFKCLICNKNLCLLCKPNHNLEHNIIIYDQINYICSKHNEHFIKYCKDCDVNIP